MRWGAGAGASRLISRQHDPAPPAGAAAGRVQGLRGGAALRLRLPRQHRHDRGARRAAARSSSPTSSTTPASSTAAGWPGPRPSSTATATSSTSPGGCARPRAAAALIVTDGVFSMDGDVAPLEDLVRLARDHGCRLMVDEAHATGALGPGGRGSVAAAGLSDEVDVVVGTLGKALGSYGAYVCAEARAGRVPGQHAPAPSSSRPPRRRPSVAAGLAALELLEADPQPGRAAARQRRRAARGAGRRGARGRRLGRRRSCRSRSATPEQTMELCERVLERGVFAQGIRPPTVPEGSSRLRFTVMATHRDGRAASAAAKLVGAAARELGIATPAAPPAGRPRRLAHAVRGRLRHRHRDRGRQDRGRRGHRPHPRRRGRREVAVFKPARDRPRRARASPTTSCCAGPPAPTRATRRSRPTATARRPRPTSPRRWPARRSTRRRLLDGAPRGRRAAPTRWSARGSAGCSCRSRPATWSATSPSTSGLPLVDRRPARPGDDQPHAADDRGGPRAPASRSSMVVLTPWPERRRARSRSRTARRSPRWARSGRDAASRLTLRDPGSWPALPLPACGLSGLRLGADRQRGDHGAGQGDDAGDGHRLAERVDEVAAGRRSRSRWCRPRPGRSRR